MMLLAMLPFLRSARLARRITPDTLLLMHFLLLVMNCQGQSNGSYLNQTVDKICYWSQMRIAPVRDVLYIDGGQRFDLRQDAILSFLGEMYFYMNFSTSFDVNQDNLTELFMTGYPGPQIEYYSGFMFADDFQFYTYGGLVGPSAGSGELPPADFVYGYILFEDASSIPAPVLGPNPTTLPNNVTRYITDGAGVSVPSEKLAFYFGGMTAQNATWFNLGDAQVPSNSLIQMDMSVPGALNASMKTLPTEVISRADGQLLWLPVSSRGLLVVLGGVVNPENLWYSSLNASQVSESERISPSFMSTINLYDIESNAWYSQDIGSVELPGQLTGFCAVVANEDSTSSFEIYVYGGYSGIVGTGHEHMQPSNDVWVLSVPSFTWTKVFDGSETSGRCFHSCVTPYPEQMWIIGGQASDDAPCTDLLIKIFNLNNLTWQVSYDPTVYDSSGYRRPAQILQTISDAESSGAIVNGAPKSMDPKLRALFTTPYDGEITVYYPYASGPSIASQVKNFIKQTLSGWFGGILGIVSYLLLSTICVTVIIFTRRRMLMRRYGAAPSISSDARSSRLVRWINNMQPDSEGKEAHGDNEEYEPSKLEDAPPKHRKGMVEKIFCKRDNTDSNRERLLRGQDDKSPSHGEVYELKSRRLDGVGYIHVPMNQEGDSPPTLP
jgi:hypothetical protein